MNQFLKSVIAASALVVATAASANPVTVTVDLNPISDAYTDTPLVSSGSKDNLVKFTLKTGPYTSISDSTYAGEFDATVSGGTSFAAYCYDLTKELKGSGSFNLTIEQLDNVARLFAVAGFDGQDWADDGVTGFQTAALQVAIWESKYDGLSLSDYSLTKGNLKFSDIGSSVSAQAITYLKAAKNLSVGSYNPNVFLYTPTTPNQALVTSVPEPSTYALMAACLGVVGFVARRKKSV